MVINQNGSSKSIPVNTLNTIIDQISALQEDLALLQSNVASFANSFSTGSLDTNHADITTATIGTENVGTATINNATITNLNASTGAITNLNVSGTLKASAITGATNVNATNFSGVTINGNTVNAGSLNVTNDISAKGLTLTNGLTANAITAPTITATTVNAPNVSAETLTVDNITASTKVTVPNIETENVEVEDINITGTATINDLNVDSVNTNSVIADDILTEDILLNKAVIQATPAILDNNDNYTIVVKPFNGLATLTWLNNNAIVWTMIIECAKGKGYNFTWNCNTTSTIEKVYQYEDNLYIVTNSNGGLKISTVSSTTVETPTILFNEEEPSDTNFDITIPTDNGTAIFNDTIYYKENTMEDFEARVDAVEQYIQGFENRFQNIVAETVKADELTTTTATLDYADIKGGKAVLVSADIQNATIKGGNVTGLSNISANNADIRNATLSDADIQNATIKGGTIEDASYINVSAVNTDTATIKTLVGLVQIV